MGMMPSGGMMPMGAMPGGKMPMGNIPGRNMPGGTIPGGIMPLGRMPGSGMPPGGLLPGSLPGVTPNKNINTQDVKMIIETSQETQPGITSDKTAVETPISNSTPADEKNGITNTAALQSETSKNWMWYYFFLMFLIPRKLKFNLTWIIFSLLQIFANF